MAPKFTTTCQVQKFPRGMWIATVEYPFKGWITECFSKPIRTQWAFYWNAHFALKIMDLPMQNDMNLILKSKGWIYTYLHIPHVCFKHTCQKKSFAQVQGATLFFQCANPAVNVYHPTSIQRLLLVLNPRIPAAAFGKSWRAGLFPQMATTSLNEFRYMFKLKTSTIPSLSGMQERFITSRLEEVPK